jgi:hypothetical protein
MRKVFYLILTGIAIGILLAPGRGSDSWQKVEDYFNNLKSNAKDTFSDLVDGTKSILEKATR